MAVGAPETTGNHPKSLWPGVMAWYGVGYGEAPEQFRQLFEMQTSTKAWEEDVEQHGYGLAQVKDQGGSVTYTGRAQGPVSRYTHVAYALGFIVTYENLKDNQYAEVANAGAKAIGFSMRQTKEINAANVYNRAFTSGYTGGDGQILCVSTHPSAAGSQSNAPTAADISEASIEDACIAIRQATDYEGLLIALQPKTLIIPNELMFEVRRILDSPLQSNGANNDINALRESGVFPGGVVINDYLTDADSWFIRTNAPTGMKCYQRDSVPMQKANDFDTMNAKAFSYDRYAFGWSDWRQVWGTAGV